MSLSAADELIDVPTAALRDRFLPALKSILPGLESAALQDFFVTREREATFLRLSPRDRPAATTRAHSGTRSIPGRGMDGHRMARDDGGRGAQR